MSRRCGCVETLCCQNGIEQAVCAIGGILTFLVGGIGALLLLSVAPQQEQMSGDMAQQQQIILTGMPETCTIKAGIVTPRCRTVQLCAESERRCLGDFISGQSCYDQCLRYSPGLACHCEVLVKTNMSGTFAGEFNIGTTPDPKKNRDKWCADSIKQSQWLSFSTIVTLAPTSQDRWECVQRHSERKDLVQEWWYIASSGTTTPCLYNPEPNVPTSCVLVESGKLMFGSKKAWVEIFNEVNYRSFPHRESVRIAGWVLTFVAAGILLVSCGLCSHAACVACATSKGGGMCNKSLNRVARVFSRADSYELAEGDEQLAEEENDNAQFEGLYPTSNSFNSPSHYSLQYGEKPPPAPQNQYQKAPMHQMLA